MVEIAVVHVSPSGEVTGRWSTLVNPERDLGARHIHGISAADVLHAPRFGDVAGELAALLRGRVPAAHNLVFDLGFLTAEFGRLGVTVPLAVEHGVCTMREAPRFLPHAPRTLADCCAVAGIRLDKHHEAPADAEAAAGLLRRYLASAGSRWDRLFGIASRAVWPELPAGGRPWVRRGAGRQVGQSGQGRHGGHFTARIPDVASPVPAAPDAGDTYLTLLDRVLLDFHIAVEEGESLVRVASELGLSRSDVWVLHREYVAALAYEGLAGDAVTSDVRRDLLLLAPLLDLPVEAVEAVMAEVAGRAADRPGRAVPRFRLRPGDLVAFTGEMEGGRDTWEARARGAGFVPHPGVTKRVRLVVSADPDSLSGKAKKAREYGIPIVTPGGFSRLLRDTRH